MKTKDNIKNQNFGGLALPKLHGHTKITLTDVKTGEKEVVEKDNLVTDAVANIFTSNFFGSMNYDKLTPLWEMFGGVLLFEDSQDTTLTLPLNDHENKFVGNAGQTSHSSASTYRGNPNGALSGEIPNGYKFTWDFATTQANGTIGSLSLCHKDGGDIGLKPYEAIANEYPYLLTTNRSKVVNSGYDADFDFSTFYLGLLECDVENETGLHVYLNGSALTVTEVKIPLIKQGILNDLAECEVVATHDVTLTRSFNARYSAIVSDSDYIYVVTAGTSAGGSTLNVDKVSKSTWTSSAADITDASLSLSNLDSGWYYADAGAVQKVALSGSYLYYPKNGNTTLYKINLSNAADITELTSNLTAAFDLRCFGMVEISDGLILGDGFIANYDTIYPVSRATTFSTLATNKANPYEMIRIIKSGDKFYSWSWGAPDYVEMTVYAGVVVPNIYLGTIQNITPVTKTNDKTMQVEYTITLAE